MINSPVSSQRPQSLQDFEPLLLAELVVLRAAAAGDIAKIGYRRPRGPTPDVRLRAEFLGFLARGGGEGAPVKGQRLQIVGASVVGRIDLAAARVPMSLWLYRCSFGAAPLLEGAQVAGSVTFADCALPGLNAEFSRIDGDLALNAGCSVDGEVQLTRAVIGRDLNCERMHMRPNGHAVHALRRQLVADGAQIGGDVNLGGGFEAVGEVRFVAAHIGGDLRADAARMMADIDEAGARGAAFTLDRVQIGGSVSMNGGFEAAGQVSMQRARIDGDVNCTGAAFDIIGDASWGDNAAALLLDRARIGGALILQHLQGPLQGASLCDARVGSLLDDASTWGQHHVLDGFSYKRFAADAPTDAPMRLDWLARQNNLHLGFDYRPDPWRRLIRVLRRMGRNTSARDVAIGREQHLRRAGLIGLGVPPALRWLVRGGHALFGAFAGYGHRPLRLLAVAGAAWLLCGAAYWAAAENGALAPSASLLAADPRLATCRTECAQLPATAPRFQPLAYSLDVLVPLIDLQQKRHWAPARDAVAAGLEGALGTPLLRVLTWFEALFGWAVGLTLLATFTGLTDRDRRA